MSTELLANLRNLTELKAPSGREDEVRDYLIKQFSPLADRMWIDPLGNLVGFIGPEGVPEITISAHMDEVGLIVKYVDHSGIIFFEKIGMIDDKILPGREVCIITKNGHIHGVIGTKSSHLLTKEDLDRVPNYREMWIDTGSLSREESVKKGIKPGCGISFATKFRCLDNDTILGKSLDDRIGCAVMVEVIKEISKTELAKKIRVSFAATVQEEVGARGAAVAFYDLNPRLLIVLDTVPCENPTVPEKNQTVFLGKGPVIRTCDYHPATMLGCITPVKIQELLERAASKEKIPYQMDCLSGTFLDSSSAQFTKRGIPTGSICFPRRYAHSPVEIANFNDIKNSVQLLLAAIREFAANPLEFIRQIK